MLHISTLHHQHKLYSCHPQPCTAVEKKLLRGFKKLLPLKGWGNARDVEKAWTSTLQHRADRVVASGGAQSDEKTLTEADVSAAMDDLVAARMGNIGT
eukprot:1269898-Prymnesium_polylepis.2